MKTIKGAIAAGHPETAKAAENVLREGGNAFDAVLAAQLVACVAEPVLTSLAGGGFLMAKTGSKDPVLYDFFVQTPLQKNRLKDLHFHPITADFGPAQQEFHIGAGSAATPGTVKGLFTIHRDLCTMPMKRLAAPAVALARKGIMMNAFQTYILDVVKPIYLSTPESMKVFSADKTGKQLVGEGDILRQPLLAEFLEELSESGEGFFYEGEIARSMVRLCREKGGHLREEDFSKYRVIKRDPLVTAYRNASVVMNPPPSSGGLMVAFALKLMEELDPANLTFGSAPYLDLLARVQKLTDQARADTFVEDNEQQQETHLLHEDNLEKYRKEIRNHPLSSRGTTHISIIDGDGNMAALSTSNGEGCGCMIPGTGIMLNNMLGEDDLNPGGFHTWPPGVRMTSMMAPGFLEKEDGTWILFGSGGSNRIRTAILQFLLNLVDFDMTLKQAVLSPRIHYENDLLNIEDGFNNRILSKLRDKYPDCKIWTDKNLFFGGTHSVSHGPNGYDGFGDPRRGGVSVMLNI